MLKLSLLEEADKFMDATRARGPSAGKHATGLLGRGSGGAQDLLAQQPSVLHATPKVGKTRSKLPRGRAPSGPFSSVLGQQGRGRSSEAARTSGRCA